jgi:CRP-like cAMP-binding protein
VVGKKAAGRRSRQAGIDQAAGPAERRDGRNEVSLKQEFELLRRVPFFADIEPAKLKLLAFMSERVGFDTGAIVVRQGDPADAAYLIIEGECEVLVETPTGPVMLATLRANEIFGEIAILCNVPRTATVRAKGRLVTMKIAREPFLRMVREFPGMAISIMQELAHRLEVTTNQLRGAMSEVRRLREPADDLHAL